MKPKAFAEKLNGLGIPLHSSHTTFEPESDEKACTDAVDAGCKYIIYPYLPEEFRQNIDGYKATTAKFNKMGETVKKFGLQFGYHNHNFEFADMNGQIGMDALMA